MNNKKPRLESVQSESYFYYLLSSTLLGMMVYLLIGFILWDLAWLYKLPLLFTRLIVAFIFVLSLFWYFMEELK